MLLMVSALCAGQVRAGTYYVSTKGDDAATGKSEKTAWRTIAYAAKVAKAGDTVLVAPGDYGDERVVFANSGLRTKPIVFKGNGGRPKLRSNDGKAVAFLVKGKILIHIEGFDVFGYDRAVYICKGSSYCQVRNMRCFGRGGAIQLRDGVNYCLVDSCYIEDTYRNAILIYGDPHWKLRPSTLNAITNCTVVRGGHSSIDVHTGCPDSYVVGCVAREKGKERDGKTAAGGFYLHNHHVDRMRVIGNAITECDGLTLIGASDCLLAENLIFNTAMRGITLDRCKRWGGKACDRNVIADNIVFDVDVEKVKTWTSGIGVYNAADNKIVRNYSNQVNRDYHCYCYKDGVTPGNDIVDLMKGHASIEVVTGGEFSLSYSAGFWPAGMVFRLTDKEGKTIIGPDGVSFGTLAPGTYTVQAILPGKNPPAPQHLRVAPMPKVEGGAVIVWADCCGDETGFILERKITGQKDFKQIAKLKANTTRYLDKKVGREKAIYRVRTVRGEDKSVWSNTDEVVRYGYWFTDRTGLGVDGHSAFGQVERGELKTLIVEKAKRVELRADAAEGVSALALLEAGKPDAPWPKSAGAKGKAEVWLVASKLVTATLRWRAGWIQGYVQGKGEYSLELHTAKTVKSATFNGKAVKAVHNKNKGLVRLDLSGSGTLAIELSNEEGA